MNLFKLVAMIGLDTKEYEGKVKKTTDDAKGFSSKLGEYFSAGVKAVTTATVATVTAAAGAIVTITKNAVENYAEYEQLVGGVETLFKDSANTLMSYASNAYKAQGISANEYMSLATSFSASLLQSLEGDTDRAVEATNLAITDMSDNANKMGTSMDMIQNAYQGFAKSNYTMLDNLKLGYGGTKEEMQRLIADAAKLSDTVDAQSMSFDNVVQAIHVVQTEMGITGTTALEASTTISGSVSTMKAAWADFLTSLADENADYQWQLDNLLESVKTVATNVYPVVKQVLWSITDMVEDVLPEIASEIPEVISEVLPRVVEIAVKLVESLVKGISQSQGTLFTSIFGIVTYIASSFITMLPEIVKLGLDLIVSLANGIAESLPKLIPTIIDVVLEIVDILTSPKQIKSLTNASIKIMVALADGLINALPKLVNKIPTIISNITSAISKNLPKILNAGIDIIKKLGSGLTQAVPQLVKNIPTIVKSVVNSFSSLNSQFTSIGSNIVSGIKKGISNAWKNLKSWFKSLFGDLISIAKKILGIKSPSRVFRDQIGKQMAAGLELGWEDEFDKVKNNIEDSLHFDDTSISIDTFTHKTGLEALPEPRTSVTFGDVIVNVDGAKYSDEQSLAVAIAEALQNMTDRKVAVYA